MIVVDLDSAEQQVPMTPGMRKALAFLRRADAAAHPDGRVELDGDAVFALPQRYDTVSADPPRFEYHRRYIDVQYLVAGEEIIGWAPAGRLSITEPYDADRDIAFGTVPPGDRTPVTLRAGQLAVLYPADGHAPRLAAGRPSRVHKIVVKVAADG